jgi:PKD repeat protein
MTVKNGSFVLLGTNDQETFKLIDSRRYVPFTAGVLQEFGFTNTVAYRCYYLYLTDSFQVGSTLDIYFNDTYTAGGPNEQYLNQLNWTMGRPPHIQVFDFSKVPLPGSIGNYSIKLNQSLVVGAEWYLYGSNTLTLGDSSATPTEIDHQVAETFTSGTWNFYPIPAAPTYNYYIFYFKSGFVPIGTRVEMRFNSPLITPTSAFSCTPTSGIHPLFVTCTDASLGTPTTWNWSFNDGNVSHLQNPTNTFGTVGSYDVNLTVCNPAGCDILVKSNYITVTGPAPPPSPVDINTQKGTTWITWTFNDTVNRTPSYLLDGFDVYVDGAPYTYNSSTNQTTISDLTAGSWHTVEFKTKNLSGNIYTFSARADTQTYESTLWQPLIIILACLLIGWFIPYILFGSVITSFWAMIMSYLQTQQSYVVLMYAFLWIVSMIAVTVRMGGMKQ